jgi:hypothetical protein
VGHWKILFHEALFILEKQYLYICMHVNMYCFLSITGLLGLSSLHQSLFCHLFQVLVGP